MPATRPVILVLADYYPPAYRAGGPTRSLPRIVERLGAKLDFRVITRGRDLGTHTSLPGIPLNRWIPAGKGTCLYLSRWRSSGGGVALALRGTAHDVLYLNSIFSIPFSLVPLLLRRFRIVPRRGLVIAPRGELDAGALSLKKRRKSLYLGIVRWLHLVDEAVWHATSELEASRIRTMAGDRRAIIVVGADIAFPTADAVPARSKISGSLAIAFLSRIARKKNLLFAIETMKGVRGNIDFDVYGPIEDRRYWQDCLRAAEGLSGIAMRYRGIVPPDKVSRALADHHILYLPTLGENFGHAIVESLVVGCPVLISDQTPWRDLEKRRAGWDLPLSQPEAFRRVLQECVGMDQADFGAWSTGARELGMEIANNPTVDAGYRELFALALSSPHVKTHVD